MGTVGRSKTPQAAFVAGLSYPQARATRVASVDCLRAGFSQLRWLKRGEAAWGLWGPDLIDVIIILVLIFALTALVIFKSLLLALAVVIGALIAVFMLRAKPAIGDLSKGFRPKWLAKCPKCKNVMNSSEVACGNCGAHAARMLETKTGKKLKCAKCDMAVENPKCPKCETIIAPKFWR